VKLQALIACATIIVTMAGMAYWWKSIKTRQTETNARIRSIAVLPFKQLGEGEKDELVGFGMADVLITRIGSLNRIEMRPTSAVFKYIGAEPDIVAVGRQLKVDAVLEGNIQRIGDRMRVTARLVRARDGELLWAETFDGRPNEPFELQDRMSERLAAALFLNPADEQKRLLTKRYTDSPEAYQAYTKGRYFLTKRTTDGMKKSIEYFEQAIEKDPSYALAFAGLADGYSLLVNYTQIAPKEGFPKAKLAATQALRIDAKLAEAHVSLAKIHHLYDWDWEAAEREFKQAIGLNPDYATAHQWYGEYLISMGRFDEAKAEMKRALDLDPVSPAINVVQGFPYYYAREYDGAITEYKKALELDPNFDFAHGRLHDVYVQKRMYDEAIAEYVASYKSVPQAQESLKAIYAASGMRGVWESSVAGSQEQLERCCSRYIAGIYALLGDRENALKWLEKAYQERSHLMVYLKVDPIWDDLRSDTRFQDLLRRMRLEP
jgi:TolB-like protein/Tfp pilus assembly protein PilF